jgi:hypothetical protein
MFLIQLQLGTIKKIYEIKIGGDRMHHGRQQKRDKGKSPTYRFKGTFHLVGLKKHISVPSSRVG